MMDAFEVKSKRLRVTKLPQPDPPLLNFLTHGTLYHHVGRKVETRATLTFVPVAAVGYGNRDASTRGELRFSFRW